LYNIRIGEIYMARDRYSDDQTIEIVGDTKTLFVKDNIDVERDVNVGGELTTVDLIVNGTFTAGSGTGDLEVSGDLSTNHIHNIGSDDLLIETHSGADLDLTSDEDLHIEADDFLSIDAGSIHLTARETGGGPASTVRLSVEGQQSFLIFADIAAGEEYIQALGDRDNDYVFRIQNNSTDSNADGLEIKLRTVTPGTSNSFIKFQTEAVSGDELRGNIRGSASTSSGVFVSRHSGGLQFAERADAESAVLADSAGDVQYTSGNSDYGEWIEAGNPSEWLEDGESPNEGECWRLGLLEGTVVYVRDGAFYKEAPGTPMVVTLRSIVVGNERGSREGQIGEILSFIGQVPVFVNGPVKSGDYLVASGKEYCTPVSPLEITFSDYLKTVGMAWGSSDKEGPTMVLAAIGKKSFVAE
jgi:hypothetical protein